MKYMKLTMPSAMQCLIVIQTLPSTITKGTLTIHHDRFLDTYAGCFVNRYGPFVRIPRCVRFEKRTPNAIVASEEIVVRIRTAMTHPHRIVGTCASHEPNCACS